LLLLFFGSGFFLFLHVVHAGHIQQFDAVNNAALCQCQNRRVGTAHHISKASDNQFRAIGKADDEIATFHAGLCGGGIKAQNIGLAWLKCHLCCLTGLREAECYDFHINIWNGEAVACFCQRPCGGQGIKQFLCVDGLTISKRQFRALLAQILEIFDGDGGAVRLGDDKSTAAGQGHALNISRREIQGWGLCAGTCCVDCCCILLCHVLLLLENCPPPGRAVC